MPKDANNVRWQSSASGRDLTWIESDGVFVSVASGAEVVALDRADLEHVSPSQPKNICGKAECSNLFPGDFNACPECGADLKRVFGEKDRAWSYPGGEGDGLLNVEWIDISSVTGPIDGGLPTPGIGSLTLIVAGQPKRLLAIDRKNSIVHAFNRQTKSWRRLASTNHFSADLASVAWSVCAFDAGFALAGADGPIVARINPLGTGLELEPLPKGCGQVVSGPGRLDDRILFLCFDRQTGLSVAIFDLKSRAWRKTVAVRTPEGACDAADTFAAPVIKEINLYWAGKSGYVALRAGDDLEALWKPWSPGFTPELHIRPIWTKRNLWQPGVFDSHQARFEALVFRGAVSTHDVESTHLTAGECSFTTGGMYATPWDYKPAQQDNRGGAFLMPICGLAGLTALVADFGIDPGSGRVNPAEVLNLDSVPKPARLLIYKPGAGSIDLGHTLGVGNILQLQCAVFDGHLIVYDADYGAISTWKID